MARDTHVERDPLVRVLEARSQAESVLDEIVRGLAVETASLAWEIRHARERGITTDRLHSRRVDGLHKIALVILGQRRLGIDHQLDPDDPRMVRLRELFIAEVQEVAEATLPKELAAVVVERLETALYKT